MKILWEIIWIVLVLGGLFVIWAVLFGAGFKEKREEISVMRYVEDNAFRLTYIFNTLDRCKSKKELELLKPWAIERARAIANGTMALSKNSKYAEKVAEGLINLVREKYKAKEEELSA